MSELVSLAEQALTGFEAGDVDVAKDRLKALVQEALEAKEEGTGCGRRTERWTRRVTAGRALAFG